MRTRCRSLQAKLAEGGPGALRDDLAGQRHLEGCGECFAVLESLARLDDALAELPQVDAPDAVVEQLLARPELLVRGTPAATPAQGFWQRLIASVSGGWKLNPFVLRTVASMALVVLVIFMISSLYQAARQARPDGSAVALASAPAYQGPPAAAEPGQEFKRELGEVEAPAALEEELEVETLKKLRALGYLGGGYGGDEDGAEAPPESELKEAVGRGLVSRLGARKGEQQPDEVVLRQTVGKNRRDSSTSDESAATIDDMVFGVPDPSPTPKPKAKVAPPPPAPASPESGDKIAELGWVGSESDISFRGGSPRTESEVAGPFDGPARDELRKRSRERLNKLPRGLQDFREEDRREGAFAHAKPAVPALAGGDQLAEIFLEERARLEGLHFQPAEGYWANTYVPGDPALRHLQASLLKRDRAALEAYAFAPLGLHDAVRQTTQPFDPPENAALAVYLHADRAALEGRQRLLLQVGLQASERLGGRRPAMNLGLVLDLRGEISTTSATTLRALMTAFAQARDLGDRFRLVVAGRPGGEVVGPEAFHHGPLAVTLQRLLTGEGAEGTTLGLLEALAAAAAAVSRDDDPTSPLGSSAVILITDQLLGADSAALGRLAHRSALQGVTVSVIGVGDRIDLDEAENLALAGQGHRRLLHLPEEATAVVERELAAVGQAVARAVRLRIRLAPGVELIDVLGSHRLDLAAAERVRQAEQSIDRRLSRNLGITADRGDDEDGIQIIIPSFYAGDSHVVLLDVVAPGPGAIVDVRVRYKDLVYFENGVVRGRLTLDRGVRPAGPLEHNVLKNLLAFDARGVFEEAGRFLRAGAPDTSRERLETFRQLLLGLGRALPDLAKDRDLERDIALLGEYVSLLDAGAASGDEVRSHLADSLRLSGRLKVLPRPAALKVLPRPAAVGGH